MTAQDQVQRLEALLARVHSRRGAPRVMAEAAPVIASPALHHAHVAPPVAAPPPARPPAPTVEVDVDVELTTETAEVDLDSIEADELAASMGSDGVAALTPQELEADEAPASSRRPIQLEQPAEPADLAFDDATDTSKSSHPAPPESGRQVALPATDFEGELSGVRPLVEPAEVTPAPPPPVAPPAAPVAAAAMKTLVSSPKAAVAPVELKGEIIRPPAAPVGPAAVFRGALPETKPETFGELLETTLGL